MEKELFAITLKAVGTLDDLQKSRRGNWATVRIALTATPKPYGRRVLTIE